MRFALVATIWLVLVGGLSLYTWQRDRHKPPRMQAEATVEAAPGQLVLEVTPAFATAGDPFALRGDPEAAATLLVRTAQRELFRSEMPLPAGVPQIVKPVPGLVVGLNELYVRAVPPVGDAPDPQVRVRLLQGEKVIVDRTIRGGEGAVVAATIPFELKQEGGSDER